MPGKSTLVICNDDPVTLKFVSGIVNSRLASFYVNHKYASASYNGGVNFTPDMLNSVPIPAQVDRIKVVAHVEKITAAQEKRISTTAALHALIRASGGGKKLGRKLDVWHSLTSLEFVNELIRQGLNLSVKDKAEWADIFDRHKAGIAKALAEVASSEMAIDQLLFDAFALSPSEQEYIRA